MNPPQTFTPEPPHLTATKMRVKHAVHRLVFLGVSLQGVWGLYRTAREIIVAYPKIADYYQTLNFNQSAYMHILEQAALVSVIGFVETAFGLAMMVRKSHTIHYLHTLLGLILLAASYYLKSRGNLLDLGYLEEIAFTYLR